VHAGQGRGHGVHCACSPCGVHGMAYVPTLDIWLRVLRGNVPGHHLLGCGYVRLTRTLGPLRGVYVTPGPIWNLARGGPCAYYELIVEDLIPPWLLRVG